MDLEGLKRRGQRERKEGRRVCACTREVTDSRKEVRVRRYDGRWFVGRRYRVE